MYHLKVAKIMQKKIPYADPKFLSINFQEPGEQVYYQNKK